MLVVDRDKTQQTRLAVDVAWMAGYGVRRSTSRTSRLPSLSEPPPPFSRGGSVVAERGEEKGPSREAHWHIMQSSGDKAANAPGTGQGRRRLLDWTTLMPSVVRRLQRSQGRMVATEAIIYLV